MSELVLDKEMKVPKNWTVTNLDIILDTLESGGRPKGGAKGIKNGIPSIGGEHLVYDGKFNFESVKFIPETFYSEMNKGHIQRYDVLVVKDGATTGKVSFVTDSFPFSKAAVNEHVFILRGNPRIILQSYLFRYLFSSEGQKLLKSKIMGSAQGGINTSFVNDFIIPIPSQNEQKRIVSKIENLFSYLNAIKKTLEEIKIKLQTYEKVILRCSFEDNILLNLNNSKPIMWSTITLKDLLEKHGIFDGPFGSNLKTKDYTTAGVRVIRLENIKKIQFDDSKQTYINYKKYKTLTKHTVNEGDVIFSSFVDPDIRCCILPKLDNITINKADCFCIRLKKQIISPEFLMYQLSSPRIFEQIKDQIHGVTRKRINTRQLKTLELMICPLEKQQIIVDFIKFHFSIIQSVYNILQFLYLQIELLERKILKQAFEGNLVPQDPNDEPAEILLQKIKQEREKLQITQRVINAKPVKSRRTKNAK